MGRQLQTVQTMWLFCPDAILDKARRAKELKPSGRLSTLSGRSVLILEIVCSRSAGCTIVRPDALSYRPDDA
jgi:hypothetical protein